MSSLQNIVALLAECNLSVCLYAALGATLIARAYIDRHAHHGVESREHAVHGLIYICIGLAK